MRHAADSHANARANARVLVLPEPGELPFKLGRSPFMIKGVAYLGTRLQYDATIPGGWNAALAAVTDRTLSLFLSQEFFASNWYDVFPLVYLDAVATRLHGGDFSAFARATTKVQAELDARGVYRLLLRFIPPSLVIDKLVVLASTYFSFGKTAVTRVSSTASEVVVEGVPAPIARWYQEATAQYAAAVLARVGAGDIAIDMHDPVPNPTDSVCPLANVSWRIHWTSKTKST